MKKLQYKIEIRKPVQVVYKTMLGLERKENYEQWTAEFNPTSTYEGSWEKGTKIRFIGTAENGERGGMVSKIVENIPNTFVSTRHFGVLKEDKEITEGPDVERWAGGHENYGFSETAGVTTVTVEVDVAEEYIDYFNDTYPRALKKLKEICEGQ